MVYSMSNYVLYDVLMVHKSERERERSVTQESKSEKSCHSCFPSLSYFRSLSFSLSSLFFLSLSVPFFSLYLNYSSPQVSVSVVPFPDTESAIGAAIQILQEGIDVARIEFLDELSMKASIQYSGNHVFSSREKFLFPKFRERTPKFRRKS